MALTAEGFEDSSGNLIYWPDEDAAIGVRDIDGDSLGLYAYGEEGWAELAMRLGLTPDDFAECDECETLHRVGRHLDLD